jgi:endonuclease/exonuclease/phosphatase (EEP) superfamily protein YafD
LLIVGALALMGAAGYLGVKFSGSRITPEIAVAAAPVLKVVEAAPIASQPMAVAQGAAAIETVTPPAAAPVSESAASQPFTVAASLNNIQQTLDRAEPAPAKKEQVASKETPAPRRVSQVNAKLPAKPTLDDDADLLAAMLPHLKRTAVAPTSPAYEKRCGQLVGQAAADCKAKFCGGKQGTDAACPAVQK